MLHWVQHLENVHLSKEAMSSKVHQVHQESAIIFPTFWGKVSFIQQFKDRNNFNVTLSDEQDFVNATPFLKGIASI
jgi:hypothetical protein